MARGEAACRGGALANTLTREVHLYVRPVPLAGLFARWWYAAWCNWGAGDTRKSGYRSATRLVRSWRYKYPLHSVPLSAACHGGQGGRQGCGSRKYALRAICSRGDRILQTAGHSHTLTMAVLRNRLLLPEAGIVPKIIKGDEDTLRLVKPTGPGSLGGATASPQMNGGHPTRRAPRFASPVKGSQYPQGGARQISLTLVSRGSTFATLWKPTVCPPGSNIPQAAARNACLGPRHQHTGSAAGNAVTSHQLREGQDQHHTEQAAQVARLDAPPGRHVCFTYRTAGRPHNHPYKAGAWTVCENCKWVRHTQRECIRDFVPE